VGVRQKETGVLGPEGEVLEVEKWGSVTWRPDLMERGRGAWHQSKEFKYGGG